MKIYQYKMVPSCVCEDAAVEKIHTPESVVAYMRGAFDEYPEKESAYLIFLNRKNIVKGRFLLSIGTQNACLVGTREVLHAALLANAMGFILVHNHPSGDPAPSMPDISVTKNLREASKLVEIDFLDHVIVGDPKSDPTGKGFFSFRSTGHI